MCLPLFSEVRARRRILMFHVLSNLGFICFLIHREKAKSAVQKQIIANKA